MLWLLTFLAVTTLSESRLASFKNYSYIENVGIPAAKRIFEIERKIVENYDRINSRIIGGFQANHENYPWLAGLVVHMALNVSVCGGSLLNPTRVLTSGHCWYDNTIAWIPEMIEVVLGSSFLYYGGTRMMTNRVITHPNWVPGAADEVDAAIVILPKAVTYSSKIQPIALPENYMGVTFEGWTVYAAGYGLIQDTPFDIMADYNQAVYLKVMNKTDCNIGPNIMCTSGVGNKGICGGDSGGPISIYHNGNNVLVGIIMATMEPECGKGLPSLHVRVNKIVDWIKQNLQ